MLKLKLHQKRNQIVKQELKHKRNKLIISAILSLPLLLVMVVHISYFHSIHFGQSLGTINSFDTFQFIIGWQFYVGALRNGSANMDVLVAVGTSAAYFYSIYEMMMWLTHQTHHHICILKQVLF